MNSPEMLWFFLWCALVRTTLWLTAAAVVLQTLIWIVRPVSPRTYRIAWACVLISGILFGRVSISIPSTIETVGAIAEPPIQPAPRPSATSMPLPTEPMSVSAPPESRSRVRTVVRYRIENEISPAPIPATVLVSAFHFPWHQAALVVWGLGVAVLLSVGVLRYVRFAGRIARFERAPDDSERERDREWHHEWNAVLDQRNARRRIPLVVSESAGPALCLALSGYRVIVPRPLWVSLPARERISILRHELAHYERGDLYQSLFALLILAMHWFNPCAWWARRQFDAAGEWACDDAAARTGDKIEFAKTLMQLAGIRSPAIPLTDAIAGGALHGRIRRLLTASSQTDPRWKMGVTALISLAVITLASIRVVRVAEATSLPPALRVLASDASEPEPATLPDEPSSSTGAPRTGTRLDPFGDPLPKGALLRLGTLRLRHWGAEQTAFSSDGEIIASLSWAGTVGLWERKTGRLIRMLQDSVGDYTGGRNFALSQDGGKLVTVGRFFENKVAKGYVCLWETRTGKKLWSATSSGRDDFETVAFSPDGTIVAAGPQPITLYDVASGKELRRCGETRSPSGRPGTMRLAATPGAIVFSPDGRTLISFQGQEPRLNLMPRGRSPKAGTNRPKSEAAIEFWEVQTGKRTASIPVSGDFQIESLFVSPDAKQLIAGGDRNVPASQFPRRIRTLDALVPEIEYWDLSTHHLSRTFRFDQVPHGSGTISLSKDQATIAWNVGNAVVIWDPVAGKPLRQFPGRVGLYSASLSPDGSAFAAAYASVIEIWETKTGKRLPADLGDFITSINAVRFSRDGRTIYTGSGDGPLTAWDAATGVLRFRKTHGPLPSISSLDVSADGQWIATCGMKEGLSDGGFIYAATLWDARTGEPVRDYYDHERPLYFTQRVAISPDSRLLALAGKRLGNEVVTQIWDVKTGKKLAEIRPEEWEMWSLCMRFSPESRSLMTFNGTSYLRRWNARTGALEKEIFAAKTPADPHRIHQINGAAIAPDFETAVSSEKRSLQTWNAHTGKLASDIQLAPTRPPRLFTDLAISGDGRLLAAVETVKWPGRGGDNVIRIYERASGRELQKIDAGTLFGGLDFSPDGSRLAGVMRDGTALIWDLSPAARQAKPGDK